MVRNWYQNGIKYVGTFTHNAIMLKGEESQTPVATIHWVNGDTFNGYLTENNSLLTIEGDGEYIYANGDSYKGNFTNNYFSGAGVYTFGDSMKYDGDFHNNKHSETAVFSHVNGSQYKVNTKRRNFKENFEFLTGTSIPQTIDLQEGYFFGISSKFWENETR